MSCLAFKGDKIVFVKHKNDAVIGEIGIWVPPALRSGFELFDALPGRDRSSPFFWCKPIFDFHKNLTKWSSLRIPGKTPLVPNLTRKQQETGVNCLSVDNPAGALLMADNVNRKAAAAIGHHLASTGRDYYDHDIVRGLVHIVVAKASRFEFEQRTSCSGLNLLVFFRIGSQRGSDFRCNRVRGKKNRSGGNRCGRMSTLGQPILTHIVFF